MKKGTAVFTLCISIVGIFVILLLGISGILNPTDSSVVENTQLVAEVQDEEIVEKETAPIHISSNTSEPDVSATTSWINNDGRFTPQAERILSWVESGQPIDISLAGSPLKRYGFQEIRVTSEEFQISTGAKSVIPSEYRVYSGREMHPDGLGESASLALVNGAMSMTVTRDGTDYLVETDPVTGELYAVALHSFDNSHSCGSSCDGSYHPVCQISEDGRMASVSAPHGAGNGLLERIPVDVVYPGDRLDAAGDIEASEEPLFEASTAGKPYLRNGPEYDASLKDILVLMISAKSQSGQTSGLSSKAATYFAITARTAEIYERQLGLRYMLQELVLIPSDSSEDDPGTVSVNMGDDLYHLQSWINSHRPQSTYKWGHAALWTYVDGGPGGTVGLAWTDGYGDASYGQSSQELAYGWSVHIHELGHNVGSTHSSGGVMNPTLNLQTENFFTPISGQSYTAAKDIYNYMYYPTKSYVFGPALLRHPEEIPFGVDDAVSTPEGITVTIDAIANDLTSVSYGTTNTIRLVEVGQVYPKVAGLAEVVNGQIEFTPASGFTGQAWFTYTLGGDVGNNGNGWLHRADVVVTVGGDSTAPSSSPALNLQNDFIKSELVSAVRINPLLNDEGSGHMWAGDVDVVLSPNDTTPESYSYDSLWLVDATIITGTGSLTIESHNMTHGSTGGNLVNTGYLVYTPGSNESGQVVIEYTVTDASGATATAQVIMAETASVGVSANYLTTAEDSGDIIEFTFIRSSVADTSVSELINFSVSGTATPNGLTPDYALAGQNTFDPSSGLGTVLIPAGELEKSVLMAVADDGIAEGQETMILEITASSSLPLSSGNSSTTIWIDDDSLVYSESFDTFTSDSASWGGWTNLKNMNPSGKGGEDWFDWSIGSGGTPSSNTGPSTDHTSGNGKYFFAEASGHDSEYSIIESPAISTNGIGAGELEFWYHMYGSNMGSLTVDLYADGVLVAPGIFFRAGQQSVNGTDWKKVSIDLGPYLPATYIQLRLRSDIGSSEISDIAIDDFSITAASSSLPQSPNILADPSSCIVEEGQGVYLSVISQGFPAPQVQWYRDGVAIPGANGAAYYINSMCETEAGTYEATVSNTEGVALSYPAVIALSSVVPSQNPDYNTWTQTYSMVEAEWSEDSDSDNDGIVNTFEFAFDLDPSVPSRSGMPVVQKTLDGGDGKMYLEITFKRKKETSGDDGIDYTVETSSDLSTWTSGVDVEEVSAVDDGSGEWENVTVRRKTPLDSGIGFLRVKVDLTSPAG